MVAHATKVNDSLAQTHTLHTTACMLQKTGDEIIPGTKAAAGLPCSLSVLLSDACLQRYNYVIRKKRL